jgi:hypothetical protein
MSIEKHAEAAANEIASWLRKEAHLFPSVGNIAEWAKLIGHYSQSAIDEALAEKMIGVLDNASNHVHEVDLLKARIAKLEGLGPLIRKALASQSYVEQLGIEAQIDAILKGEQ